MKNPRLRKLHDKWLIEARIEDMQEKLGSGEVSSVDLVQMYLYRIAKYDKSLRTVIELNPDALQIAMALDAERKLHGSRGALHGIPILLKDNIDTGDKMHTTAGSLAMKDHYAAEDSFVAGQLRKSGAILLGKTNMTEWANFMTVGMPSGYSSRGGQTLNPYGPGKIDVGGSSSGSGAAIAANFAAAAVGTETSGSILNPSLKNALVGIKPTVGLVSRKGVIPIAHSQDTPGPMARTVKDAAYLLALMAGVDEKDPVTGTNTKLVNFAEHLKETSLKDMRIGIARGPFTERISKHKLALFDGAIHGLRDLGAELINDIEIASAKEGWEAETLIHEFKSDLNAYLQATTHSNKIRSLADVILYNNDHPDEMLKYGQKLLEASEKTSGTLLEMEYIHTLEKELYLSREQGIDYALQKYKLDAILFAGDRGSDIAAKAGYPSVIVPAGFIPNGEPFGIMFTGTSFSEQILLKIAYAFEQATKHRQAPKLE
ncbi:amidase family protein [Bacillus sp. FSL K6-3431]|uniref:amidase family protein n=1 Tax=Bacillus sp. FSL K6-3431 TaxID=2921500 RepID=UPI0030F8EE55